MPFPLVSWLNLGGAAALCLAAQVPQSPGVAAIDAYVHRIDADKTLSTMRHMHTYGHADKPGADSLFWAFNTDFPGSSAIVYFSNNTVVKIIETARTDKYFTENIYYLQNRKLLFVSNRQVSCPILTQIAAWRNHVPPCTRTADYFFQGTYYFTQDSCTRKRENGKSKWQPDYTIPGGGGRFVTVPKFFPYQVARYLAAFPHPSAPKRR